MIITKEITQNKYKNKITCFTVNAFDNGYYKDGLPVDEANKKMWLDNVGKFRGLFDFKVYDYTHPLVIECKEKYKEFLDREDIWPCIKADIIRLYILSKLSYHLYIDDDIVLCKDFKIKDEEDYFFSPYSNFCCIYNGSNLDVFKEILEVYPFDDKQLDENLELTHTQKKEFEKNNCVKRVDFYLMNCYKPLKKFKKEGLYIGGIEHHYHYYIRTCFNNNSRKFCPKKIYLVFEKDIKINIEKENFYFIFTKKYKFIDDLSNYTGNILYLYDKVYTKEYIIKRIREYFKIENINEYNKITEICLGGNYESLFC